MGTGQVDRGREKRCGEFRTEIAIKRSFEVWLYNLIDISDHSDVSNHSRSFDCFIILDHSRVVKTHSDLRCAKGAEIRNAHVN